MKTQFSVGALAAEQDGIKVIREGSLFRVYFNFEEVDRSINTEDDEDKELVGIADYVDVQGDITYASVVSAIVSDRYSADDVQALIANYTEAQDSSSDITDEKRAEYAAEYAAFQAYRRKAKAIAQQVINGSIR
jgi:hypothetical protein